MSYERFLDCMKNGLPYFGEYWAALQGAAFRHAFMRQLVATEVYLRDFGIAPLRILEIGSWAGGSAVTWAKALMEFKQGNGVVICVDAWAPYEIDQHETGEVMRILLERDEIYGLFAHNIRTSGVGHIVRAVRATSTTALCSDLGKFDIIFVDGSHSYSNVRQDIELSMPLLVEGGVLCGDDLEQQACQVDQAHMVAHCESDFTPDPTSKIEYHPGVTRAVWECIGQVENWEGFWAARRVAGQWQCVELLEFERAKLAIPPHILEGVTDVDQALGGLLHVGRILWKDGKREK